MDGNMVSCAPEVIDKRDHEVGVYSVPKLREMYRDASCPQRSPRLSVKREVISAGDVQTTSG